MICFLCVLTLFGYYEFISARGTEGLYSYHALFCVYLELLEDYLLGVFITPPPLYRVQEGGLPGQTMASYRVAHFYTCCQVLLFSPPTPRDDKGLAEFSHSSVDVLGDVFRNLVE